MAYNTAPKAPIVQPALNFLEVRYTPVSAEADASISSSLIDTNVLRMSSLYIPVVWKLNKKAFVGVKCISRVAF